MQTLSPVPEVGATGPTLRGVSLRAPQSLLSRIGWSAGLLMVLLVALYARIGVKLVHDWITIPDNSTRHPDPIFCRVPDLGSARPPYVRSPEAELGRYRADCTGVAGAVSRESSGADLFLSRFSFLLCCAAGITWTLLGRPMLSHSKFILLCAVSLHSISHADPQPHHLPAATLRLRDVELDSSDAGSSSAARWQCDPAARDAA